MDKKILTIQDISCVGQCSLTVALPIISACGIETAILPGSLLSNHTAAGYSGWTFHDLTEQMPAIMKQWMAENISFDAFYTGYVSTAQIPYILDIMKNVAKPDALKIVDPAMADNGKLYAGFDLDFPKKMLKLVEVADVVIPNLTEAALLLDIEYKESYSKNEIEEICMDLHEKGAKNVVITGVSFETEKLGCAVFNGQDFFYYFTERLDGQLHGTGDIFASVLSGALLRGKSLNEAASLACDFVVKAIKATAGDKEHWYGVKFEKAIPYLIQRLK